MLYNIPGRSVVNMSAETIIHLSTIENIVSVKEASGDLEQVAQIIENTSANFSVYAGDDGMTLPMLSIGADGVVSVASRSEEHTSELQSRGNLVCRLLLEKDKK